LMPKKENKPDLTEKVMGKIHEDKVKMRPRSYFVIGGIILAVGLAVALLTAGFFTNLAFFRLRAHAPFNYFQFGPLGFHPFLATFPWLHILVAIGGFIAVILLLRHYDISYKKRFLGLVGGVLALVMAVGLILSFARFNERIEVFRGSPPPNSIRRYPNVERFAGQDWIAGEISEVRDQELVITTFKDLEVTVTWNENTRLPNGADFEVGEKILAIGEWKSENAFTAEGIAHEGTLMNLRRNPEVGYGRRSWR